MGTRLLFQLLSLDGVCVRGDIAPLKFAIKNGLNAKKKKNGGRELGM